MAARRFTTKGVNHAALLVPASGGPGLPTEYDIKGIQKADFGFATTNMEVWGDDTLETVWVTGLKGDLKLFATHLDPAILQLLTGNAVTTTSPGVTAQVDTIYLGTENLYTAEPVMLKIKMTARDENEVAREVTITFFSCLLDADFKPAGFDQKGVSLFEWDFSLKPASLDEGGVAITPVPAIAKLVTGPVVP